MTALHTVTVHGTTVTEDDWTTVVDARIEFTCAGDETSPCHIYPDCGHDVDYDDEHNCPAVPHAECWMQGWFDNDTTVPNAEDVEMPRTGVWECKPGMSGPIEATFEYNYVAWRFKEADVANPEHLRFAAKTLPPTFDDEP